MLGSEHAGSYAGFEMSSIGTFHAGSFAAASYQSRLLGSTSEQLQNAS